MGRLGNILGVLALLLAGSAAFFSFTISQRRVEFRQRADKLAKTVDEIVGTVDADSGTSLKSSVNFTPGDAKAGKKGTGSLSADKFHEAKDESGEFAQFQELLTKAVNHVKSLAQQRNELADALNTVATTLALPPEQLELADLRSLNDAEAFGNATQTVQSHITAVSARDQAMMEALAAAAREIGDPIDEDSLTTRKESQNDEGEIELGEYACADTLSSFRKNVAGLNERATAFVDAVVEGIDKVEDHNGVFSWETDKGDLKSKDKADYDAALTSMINDLGKLNEQLDNLVAARTEIAAKKQQINQLETDLSDAQTKLNTATLLAENQKKEIRSLERKIQQLDPTLVENDKIGIKELVGSIRQVDSDYNYVILDLGRVDGLQEGTEMLVSRGDEYIAKVTVAKVLNRISVADIMPVAMNGTVKPQDRVIMPTAREAQ